MRIYDLIAKKRDGGTHSREELEAIVNGFVSGEVEGGATGQGSRDPVSDERLPAPGGHYGL